MRERISFPVIVLCVYMAPFVYNGKNGETVRDYTIDFTVIAMVFILFCTFVTNCLPEDENRYETDIRCSYVL